MQNTGRLESLTIEVVANGYILDKEYENYQDDLDRKVYLSRDDILTAIEDALKEEEEE